MPLEAEDPHNPTEEQLKRRAFKEFVLPPVDDQNLHEIEEMVDHAKPIADPKSILEYLQNLSDRISEAKRVEMTSAGNQNRNCDAYLRRIERLTGKIPH